MLFPYAEFSETADQNILSRCEFGFRVEIMNAIVYILGIVLQAVAGVIALAQVRHAPNKLPWLLIALSSLLIVARRTATLSQFMETGRELAAAEIITLIVSLLFFLGVILMTRMFRNVLQNQVVLQQSEESLRRQRTLLQNMERISKVGGWEYDITAKRMIWTDGLPHLRRLAGDVRS
jgi:hypothetical protein